MTGSLRNKMTTAGKSYYYVKINYKDSVTKKWKSKTIATGLEVKNNRRKAEAMIPVFLKEYAWLEEPPKEFDCSVPIDITLCEYLDLWLEDKRKDLKRSTFEGYAYRVEAIKKYFEKWNPQVVNITPKMLDTFFKYCLLGGRENKKTKERGPLSVRSVRSYKSILFSVFTQASIDGLITYNPLTGISVHGKKNKAYSEEELFLTEKEISDLLHFLAEKYPRLVGIAFMGAYYGLRRSEILGLKWENVDFYKKQIAIRHTVVRLKTLEASDSTKTAAGRRILNLFDTAEQCLLKIKAEQEENRKFYQSAYQNEEGYIFTWENGKAYDPDYISKRFKHATKAFGRPEITLHKLRHSCASMLINKGWDVKQLQYWLGHTDIQTTLNIYAHFDRQRLNTSVNDLCMISMASADIFA